MRIGMTLDYHGGFVEAVAELRTLEQAGLDIVLVAEAYTFDAVSQLGYIAAKTDQLRIASGVLPIYSRTPSLIAMTAAGLDYVSGGRFTLGLGVSGPQAIEGFHGVRYDAPIGRTREVVSICRSVWRREPLVHNGRHYQIPLPAGLGKPLKLINHPVRERIPIVLGAIGPKNVALAAEVAEGWLPAFFHPDRAGSVWGDALAEGRSRRPAELGELDVCVSATTSIGNGDHCAALRRARTGLALYIGGMGARTKNFYNDLARRYGYAAEAEHIQNLYLDGKKTEATEAVPEELVRATTLIGTASEVKERLTAYQRAGVTTLLLQLPTEFTPQQRVHTVEKLAELVK
jgi:F420-dependent oxidoreductase-like protein